MVYGFAAKHVGRTWQQCCCQNSTAPLLTGMGSLPICLIQETETVSIWTNLYLNFINNREGHMLKSRWRIEFQNSGKRSTKEAYIRIGEGTNSRVPGSFRRPERYCWADSQVGMIPRFCQWKYIMVSQGALRYCRFSQKVSRSLPKIFVGRPRPDVPIWSTAPPRRRCFQFCLDFVGLTLPFRHG